jgi:hypothetical protein
MKDTYVFSALTLIAVYALSLRKRRFEIKENLISLRKNMQVNQEERDATAAQNVITTIHLPASNPPSPLSDTEILNTPTPRHKGEDVNELTFETNRAHEMCMFSGYVCIVFSTIVYFYCASTTSNICFSDVFGPEL